MAEKRKWTKPNAPTCVTPNGRTDCHGRYVNIRNEYVYCSFCGGLLSPRPTESHSGPIGVPWVFP